MSSGVMGNHERKASASTVLHSRCPLFKGVCSWEGVSCLNTTMCESVIRNDDPVSLPD